MPRAARSPIRHCPPWRLSAARPAPPCDSDWPRRCWPGPRPIYSGPDPDWNGSDGPGRAGPDHPRAVAAMSAGPPCPAGPRWAGWGDQTRRGGALRGRRSNPLQPECNRPTPTRPWVEPTLGRAESRRERRTGAGAQAKRNKGLTPESKRRAVLGPPLDSPSPTPPSLAGDLLPKLIAPVHPADAQIVLVVQPQSLISCAPRFASCG